MILKRKKEETQLLFRSHALNFDVCEFAKKFDGDGHKVAAGTRLSSSKSVEEGGELVLTKSNLN